MTCDYNSHGTADWAIVWYSPIVWVSKTEARELYEDVYYISDRSTPYAKDAVIIEAVKPIALEPKATPEARNLCSHLPEQKPSSYG